MILRRRSWPVMTWVGIGILWCLYLFVLLAALAREDYATALFFAAVVCGITALLRRIGSCRTILQTGHLLVLNPLSIHQLPYGSVRNVEITSSGGLLIVTVDGDAIRPFGFGGSLLDAYFKTSEKAAAEIRRQLQLATSAARPRGGSTPTSRLRHCWSADVALVLAGALVLVGAVVR